MNLRTIVIGLGTQGYKRRHYAGNDFIASIDPVNPEANYCDILQVPLDSFDAALVCTPDQAKFEIVRYLLSHNKHVLIEKPLLFSSEKKILELQKTALEQKVTCYTAYNHRFEPSFAQAKATLSSGELGKVYSLRMFYGNGTAKLVKDSVWRDVGAGVIPDLGSHLLDTCNYWFGSNINGFKLVARNRFENEAPDHAVIVSTRGDIFANLEMTLCMWRNHFTCDILAQNGSLHIESLCKWGPARLTLRKRILPSGKPTEFASTWIEPDPTWALEYAHFKGLIDAGIPTDLSGDLYVLKELKNVGGVPEDEPH